MEQIIGPISRQLSTEGDVGSRWPFVGKPMDCYLDVANPSTFLLVPAGPLLVGKVVCKAGKHVSGSPLTRGRWVPHRHIEGVVHMQQCICRQALGIVYISSFGYIWRKRRRGPVILFHGYADESIACLSHAIWGALLIV